ncbi:MULTISPECIES: hypothetical protein [Corynebacterium]|uniref:Uncharacterized protein n=1 Tax=Corynebacterium amycolatum TaxID=43765 RepID=A0AAW9SUB5_CORAY|nr:MULTISPECIES: hypothetical protein [Corynebacterium]MDK7246558.1 hypothetical protein [Corynebacterium amycolatum]
MGPKAVASRISVRSRSRWVLGFNLKDMLAARGVDFVVTNGILTATVNEDYTRVVPVARSWTDDLIALTEGVGPDEYVFYHGLDERKRRDRLKVP